MAMTARERPGDAQRLDRRVMCRVPVHVGTFLDLICKYSGVTKKSMITDVWAAGFRELFGVTPDELEKASFSIPPTTHTQRNADLKELTQILCGGRRG